MNDRFSMALAIPCDQALQVAQQDAERAYGNLAAFRIVIALQDDGWHIDYELKNQNLNGGGPHYIIDTTNGAIVSKRYEQ